MQVSTLRILYPYPAKVGDPIGVKERAKQPLLLPVTICAGRMRFLQPVFSWQVLELVVA